MRNYMTTFNPFFDSLLFGKTACDSKLMRTDIKETQDNFILLIDIPNVTKENLKVSLKEGSLTVSVNLTREEKEEETYLLKERFAGTYERSYYVGDDVKLSDISAKLDNGVLTLTIKKPVEEKPVEEFIDIE